MGDKLKGTEYRIRVDGYSGPVPLIIHDGQGADYRNALELIRRTHYQTGEPRGRVIVAKLRGSDIVGAAVIGMGCVRGKPTGRKYLATEHFPKLDLLKTPRDETIRIMKLAMIHRVAVEPAFRQFGIGEKLALECRRIAPHLHPAARFVEVITTRRLSEAEALIKSGKSEHDFLQRAGFVLAPAYTGRGWRVIAPKSKKAEISVRLYYWAEAIR